MILKKKLNFLILIISIIIILLTSCSVNKIDKTTTSNNIDTTSITTITNKNKLGTWWWDKSLDLDTYLDFAVTNDVTEIYFCDYLLSNITESLLEKAYNNSIEVYLLLGEKEWLNDRTDLDNLINNYIEFQNNNEYKLNGIHLDIEPHQFSDFSTNRYNYLYKLIDLIKTNKYLYPSLEFSYDIPFWLDDVIDYNNEEKAAYMHIIDYADKTFIMSYRDNANLMYDVSKDEIDYAESNNKLLYLSSETYSEEGDSVSFLEEGSEYMYNELNKLRDLIPSEFGIAIHNIKSWYEL